MKHPPRSSLDVSRETLERLQIFTDLLLKWSPTINLVGRGELGQLWPRHIADSLQLLPLLPLQHASLTDLGSGAGFPGLVLAIATELPVDLIEADQRKAAFLREAARACAARVTVHARRIEELSLPPAQIVTARAVAPLGRLLDLAQPKLQPDGICLFMKGRNVEMELTDAQKHWHMDLHRVPSRTDAGATILHITGLRRRRPALQSP